MSGVKYSGNKLAMSKLFVQFPNALKAVILASTFGHMKYEEHDEDWLNYRRVSGQSYEDAMIRHQMLTTQEEEESLLPPKFHVAWNALADLEQYLEAIDNTVEEIAEIRIEDWRKMFSKKYV